MSDEEFQAIRTCAEGEAFTDPIARGARVNIEASARQAYVEKLMQFVSASALKPLKIVVNAGNGAAGPTFDALAAALETKGVPGRVYTRASCTRRAFSKWHSKPAAA